MHFEAQAAREAKLDQRFQELDQHIETIWGLALAREEDLGLIIDPLFDAQIMTKPLPKHFKVLQLDIYDESTNPIDHLKSFKALMYLNRATDEVLYRAFPSTLHESP